MYKCFVEYRIEDRYLDDYYNWVKEKRKSAGQLTVYEGTDQKGLFVEVWDASTGQEAENIKKERCDERSSWYAMSGWVAGGAAKVHAWVFHAL
jgi:hypothetical protein